MWITPHNGGKGPISRNHKPPVISSINPTEIHSSDSGSTLAGTVSRQKRPFTIELTHYSSFESLDCERVPHNVPKLPQVAHLARSHGLHQDVAGRRGFHRPCHHCAPGDFGHQPVEKPVLRAAAHDVD